MGGGRGEGEEGRGEGERGGEGREKSQVERRRGKREMPHTLFDELNRLEGGWYTDDVFYLLLFDQLSKALCSIYYC